MNSRTTLILPSKLLADAKKAMGAKTKTETIIRSLELVVHRKKTEAFIGLFGKFPLDVDVRKSRQRSS